MATARRPCSGGTEANAFYAYTDDHQSAPAYRVTSAGAIPTGKKQVRLWARNAAQPEDGGEIPASFPNGYAAFYCMQQHITSRQYAWFLETIPVAQAEERWNTSAKWIRGAPYTGRNHTQIARTGTIIRQRPASPSQRVTQSLFPVRSRAPRGLPGARDARVRRAPDR